MSTYKAIANVFLFCLVLSVTADDVKTFRAAVVEYSPQQVNGTSKENVFSNLNVYREIVGKLISKFDDLKIIVFPEGGLLGSLWFNGNRSAIYGETIPDKNTNVSLCDASSQLAYTTLACLANSSKVHIVANLVEKTTKSNGTLLFNTNIVFDAKGSLIAKYRKYNLFDYENYVFNKTDQPEIAYFDADFGDSTVRFGTFTSFDILFKSPAQDVVNGTYNVSHVVYPSVWQEELPHLSALQAQSAWAYGTNKTLLAAGLNNPKESSSGTGVFVGRAKESNSATFNRMSAQNQINGTFAIVSYVPVSSNVTEYYSASEIFYFYNTTDVTKTPLKCYQEKLDVYTLDTYAESNNLRTGSDNSTLYVKNEVKKSVCNRGFCCQFSFNVTKMYMLNILTPKSGVGDEFGQHKYRLAVFNGVRKYESYRTAGVQVCSIVSCLNNATNSCGKRTDDAEPETVIEFSNYRYTQLMTMFENVEIKANFSTNNSFVSSNTLVSSNYLQYPQSSLIRFGKVLDPATLTISKTGETFNGTTPFLFKSNEIIVNPASISLYNRLFNLDGQKATGDDTTSSGFSLKVSVFLLTFSIVLSLR